MLHLVHARAASDETMRRLARKAADEHVQVYQDARDGRMYASSVSQPGFLHHVTLPCWWRSGWSIPRSWSQPR
jgi:hypothetical protein